MRTGSAWLLAALMLSAFACGGSKQPKTEADAPKVATSTSAKKTESSKPAEKQPAEEKSGRKPRDILGDADVTFVLAFDSSDPGKAAEEKCSASSKGDAKKQNQCMAAARDRIVVDAHRFKQDDEKNWWWLSLRRKGNTETPLHKVQFEFGDETDHSIVIKPKGRDSGTTPWGSVPKEVTIEVPNTFSISIKDPQLGTMVYEAKILLSEKK